MKNTFFNNFPRKHNKHSPLHKRLMFFSIWVKNKQQSVYVDLQKTDFEPRLLKIGEKWVFLENTRLPQKASETTADDVENFTSIKPVMFKTRVCSDTNCRIPNPSTNVWNNEEVLRVWNGFFTIEREMDEQYFSMSVLIPLASSKYKHTLICLQMETALTKTGKKKSVGPNSGPHPLIS